MAGSTGHRPGCRWSARRPDPVSGPIESLYVTNLGLLASTIPLPPAVHALCLLLALGALAGFLPLAVRAVMLARRHSSRTTPSLS